jgi:cyclase
LRYYLQGADELIYMDCVASLYGRNHLGDIVKAAAKDIFVPITVGGGIRSVEDATEILRAGADKVAVNTAAVSNPQLITDIARRFGSQCMVLSIEAKQVGPGRWEVYTDNGRERTGLDVVEWVKRGVAIGAGEILLTSVDREGTRKGFDIALVKAVSAEVAVPVIASGGMGKPEDLLAVVNEGGADAVAMADILHYKRADINDIRTVAENAELGVRHYDCA